MDSSTAKWIRLGISSLVSGLIGGGTLLLTNFTPEGGLKPGALLIALITALVLCGKDIQSSLSSPPSSQNPTVGK